MIKKVPTEYVSVVTSLAVLAMVIYFVGARVDREALVRVWAGASAGPLVVAVGLMFAIALIAALRLFFILRESMPRSDARVLSLVRIHLISQFIAHGSPVAAFGDLARAALLKLRLNLTIGGAVRLVIFERTLGLFGMIFVGVLTLPYQYWCAVRLELVLIQALVWTAGIVAVALLFAVAGLNLQFRWRPGDWTITAIRGLADLLRRPRFLLVQAALAILYCGAVAGTFAALAKAMSIELSSDIIVAFTPIILLVSSLPIFFVGWGGRELIVLLTLGAVGHIPESQALALSVGYGVVVFVAALPGGILWLMRPSLRKQTWEMAQRIQPQ